MKERSADFPDPVGPSTMACPTSPTWRENRKGVFPEVFAKKSGGASKCRSFSWPGQSAEMGNRWHRLSEVTSGRRIFAQQWPGKEPSHACKPLSVSFFETNPAALMTCSTLDALSARRSGSGSQRTMHEV